MHLESWQRAQLHDLRHHWGEVYAITFDSITWRASWLAHPVTVMRADSSQELRAKIRADYFARKMAERQRNSLIAIPE